MSIHNNTLQRFINELNELQKRSKKVTGYVLNGLEKGVVQMGVDLLDNVANVADFKLADGL